MKIAFITYNGVLKYSSANNFSENEDLLPFLRQKGLDVTSEIWDDPKVDWSSYDVAILKTPWDYHQKFEQFNIWLDKIQSLDVKLLNDFSIVRWNMDKHYLQEVEKSGFEIIPSIFLPQGWNGKFLPLFEQLESEKLIIKPSISGGSRNTMILDITSAEQEIANVVELLSDGDYIVQPMMPQIEEGEWSFIFFNGIYSHTIIKKPKSGDFRVQQVFGGTIETVSPEEKYINEAERYIAKFAKNTLYARVDGLMVNDRFVLMELELVEPFLYLSYHPNAVENYYKALLEQLNELK